MKARISANYVLGNLSHYGRLGSNHVETVPSSRNYMYGFCRSSQAIPMYGVEAATLLWYVSSIPVPFYSDFNGPPLAVSVSMIAAFGLRRVDSCGFALPASRQVAGGDHDPKSIASDCVTDDRVGYRQPQPPTHLA